MSTKLHGRATTTPAVRKAIRESKETIKTLAQKYGINHNTVKKWRKRTTVEDQKCGPEARSTTLTRTEEAIIVAFRKHTSSPLDECFYILKKEIPTLTRSSLYRCLKRNNINKLPKVAEEKRIKKKFKEYPPGYVHVDITQVYTEEGKLYLFVGIDRTTKFVFTRFYKTQTAQKAVIFLREMQASFPNLITKILTDNGLQFTRHKGDKQGHIFTQTCKELGIEHRLTKPFHPWTNGQVERMNRTIKEATIKKFYYENHAVLQRHLQVFVDAYNYAHPLKSLKGLSPYEKICLFLRSDEGKSSINTSYKFPKPNI